MNDVAFIVATRNRPQWLATALLSLRASVAATTAAIQILVIDDHSDQPYSVEAIARDCGADYLRLPRHSGFVRARIRGLQETESHYFAFFDDDDFMMPRWLPLHLDRITDADVVSSAFYLADERLRITRDFCPDPVSLPELLRAHVGANDGSLVRREIVKLTDLRPELDTVAMMGFWLALASRGARFARIDEPTWLYRRHSDSMSANLTPKDAELRKRVIAEYAKVPA